MKKYIRSSLIIIVVIALAAVIFMLMQTSFGEKVDEPKYDKIDLGSIYNELSGCVEKEGVVADYCVQKVSQGELDKIAALGNLEGSLICETNIDKNEECNIEYYFDAMSKTEWQFLWTTSRDVQKFHTITFWRNGEDYYLGISEIPPISHKIYQLKSPDVETLRIIGQ